MRRPWLRAAASLSIGVAAVAIPVSGHAQTQTPAVFAGSATAIGVRVALTTEPGIHFKTPFDGGGPTAQVAVDTLGSSNGYAAFPDPGQDYVTLPGLVTGSITGAGGPVLPTPPNYPFYLQSDAGTAPDQQAGAGFYELKATSRPDSSDARARIGFATGIVGNVGQATSTAMLAPEDDGSIVSMAESHVEGLVVGPIAIGEIKSTARMRSDPSGASVPTTDLQINAMRIGGVAVQVHREGIGFGEPSVPLPIEASLKELLGHAGMTVTLIGPRHVDNTVTAPAIEITMPYETPPAGELGGHTGTLRIVVGSAAATLTAAAGSGGSEVAIDTGGGAPGLSEPAAFPPASTAAGSDTTSLVQGITEPAPSGPLSDLVDLPVESPASATATAPAPSASTDDTTVPAASGAPPTAAASGATTQLVSALDASGSYLMAVVASAVLALVWPLRRFLGGTS
jgi:hypothetical protein